MASEHETHQDYVRTHQMQLAAERERRYDEQRPVSFAFVLSVSSSAAVVVLVLWWWF